MGPQDHFGLLRVECVLPVWWPLGERKNLFRIQLLVNVELLLQIFDQLHDILLLRVWSATIRLRRIKILRLCKDRVVDACSWERRHVMGQRLLERFQKMGMSPVYLEMDFTLRLDKWLYFDRWEVSVDLVSKCLFFRCLWIIDWSLNSSFLRNGFIGDRLPGFRSLWS